jgi:cobalamin biosynthetic protein CobC
MQDTIVHGGALIAAMRAFPAAPKPWLDLSTGINPIAFPVGEIALPAFARLPEREEIYALEAAARDAYGVPAGAQAIAGAGAQNFINCLPQVFAARRVAILDPTYAEHEARWRASGADVSIVATLDEDGDADTMVVVNPNNPDGRIVPVDALAATARRLAARGGRLIVDEAFADVSSREISLVPHLDDAPAIVLRSFGKIFGLAGVRLGFAIARGDDATHLRENLGPWPVSGPAIAIGRRALADADWRAAAIARLTGDAARLDLLLRGAGMTIAGGTFLFRLADHCNAAALHRHLCEHGILVRSFADRPALLRFGLPGGEADWTRLEGALNTSMHRRRRSGFPLARE